MVVCLCVCDRLVYTSQSVHGEYLSCKNEYILWLFLYFRDEDTKAPDSFIKRRFTSPKSGIISSFLEDCLSVDGDKKVKVSSS